MIWYCNSSRWCHKGTIHYYHHNIQIMIVDTWYIRMLIVTNGSSVYWYVID